MLTSARDRPARATSACNIDRARRRILDTAHRLFAAEGIQAAGVDRIVAHVVFYRHFPAKDDLVCVYLAELSERQLTSLRRLPADAELPHARAAMQ